MTQGRSIPRSTLRSELELASAESDLSVYPQLVTPIIIVNRMSQTLLKYILYINPHFTEGETEAHKDQTVQGHTVHKWKSWDLEPVPSPHKSLPPTHCRREPHGSDRALVLK